MRIRMKTILRKIQFLTLLLVIAATSYFWSKRNSRQEGAAIQTQSSSLNIESSPTGIHISFVTGVPIPSHNWLSISTWNDSWGIYTETVNGRPVRYRNIWHPPLEHMLGFQWEKRTFSNGDTAWSLVVPYFAILLLTGSCLIWRIVAHKQNARGFEVRPRPNDLRVSDN
jgi:hypothetical protein